MTINHINPNPRDKHNKPKQFAPFRFGKTKPFLALLFWRFNFLFWNIFALIVGGICGGLIVAGFFRSRGW